MKQPHIGCDEKDISKDVIIVGDPARVDRVGTFLNEVKTIAYNREYKSIKGKFQGQDITVISTGIGSASAGIAIEELIACGAKRMIRVGSAGAYQKNIGLGELIIATAAVRDDGGSKAYIPQTFPAVGDTLLTAKLITLAKENGIVSHNGLVRCHDSFYTSQEEELMAYWNKANVLGADMETAILFTLGQLRGIQTASLLNNVVEYQQDVKEGIGDYTQEEKLTAKGEKNAILLALTCFGNPMV